VGVGWGGEREREKKRKEIKKERKKERKKGFEHFSVFLSVVEIRTTCVPDPLPFHICPHFQTDSFSLTLQGIQAVCHCIIVLPSSTLP
jgi:hypothetical protein